MIDNLQNKTTIKEHIVCRHFIRINILFVSFSCIASFQIHQQHNNPSHNYAKLYIIKPLPREAYI